MFREHGTRRAFLGNVRFDLPWNAAPDLGLSPGSLEADVADRVALHVMRVRPDWVFALSGGARRLGRSSRRLVRSFSGLCPVARGAPGRPGDRYAARRRMARAPPASTSAASAARPIVPRAGTAGAFQASSVKSS